MIERTFEVPGTPRVVINIASGSIEMVEGAPGAVRLQIEGARDNELEITHVGETVSVRRTASPLRSSSTRIRSEVPPGTETRLRVASARVDGSVRLGDSEVDTASGDVSLKEVGEIRSKSASGDLVIGTISGEASLRTASGDVRVGHVFGRLEVTTASGSVEIGTAGDDLVSSASSGDLAIRRYEGSDLDLKSVSGDIRVGLPAGTKLALDARSLSGAIRLPERSGAQSGEGNQVRARIRAVSGDIEIRRVE